MYNIVNSTAVKTLVVMGLVILLVQIALVVGVTQCQESFKSSDLGNVHSTFQEIKGLPANQQGFTITHPSLQQNRFTILTQEQQLQVKAQEDFRRSVAQANRQRTKGAVFKTSETFPIKNEEEFQQQVRFESAKRFTRPNKEILKQQLPLTGGSVELPFTVDKFESVNTADTVLSSQSVGESSDGTLSQQQFDAQRSREQAENAKYSFMTSVSDSVNDNSHIRQETRDGLKLTGLYSYSDGYFKRTVHYVADENGYRVVKQESEPIGTGPQINPTGTVDVSTQVGDNSLQYTIKGENLPPPFQRKPVQQKEVIENNENLYRSQKLSN